MMRSLLVPRRQTVRAVGPVFSRSIAALVGPWSHHPAPSVLKLSRAVTRSNFALKRHVQATAPPAQSVVGAFPSITISRGGVAANGTFAEAQVNFLSPHPNDVAELDEALSRAKLGVVAHYYMDPEVQGLISSARWPHVTISDSLAMGGAAVKMVREGGVRAIACLGVDFMAESVKATLDKEGITDVPVYRLAQGAIGCSLAESAEGPAYRAWLQKAAERADATSNPALHVVYINTSIVTKAESQTLVPTITCTSSNVVQTVLQAFAQVPDLTVWYGPDTYMGQNLRRLFATLADTMDDAQIKEKLHPAHSKASLRAMLDRFEVFPQGNCVVHHMFGGAVAEKVRVEHADSFVAAHLEVPGEMFDVANEKVASGKGVVGSTSNILNFIVEKTNAAVNTGKTAEKLSFVLGTEAGMITQVCCKTDPTLPVPNLTLHCMQAAKESPTLSYTPIDHTVTVVLTMEIVRQVQDVLERGGDRASDIEVEIVFPVAAEAVSATGECPADGLAVVPGTSGGEGCSAAGGCATCPFMKMNDIDALLRVANKVASGGEIGMEKFLPIRRGAKVNGQPAGVLGTVPITHMRHLSSNGVLSGELVQDMMERQYC